MGFIKGLLKVDAKIRLNSAKSKVHVHSRSVISELKQMTLNMISKEQYKVKGNLKMYYCPRVPYISVLFRGQLFSRYGHIFRQARLMTLKRS